MLFQEAVHRLTMAATDMEAHDEAWRGHLHHVREIYFELIAALDHEAAPELCANLGRLYQWCQRELVSAGREENTHKVRNVLRVTTTLLDGWQAVASGRSDP